MCPKKKAEPLRNILIVDDIGKNIQLLASILKNEKYAISFATDGQQALEMIRNEQYDLILLDIMMPGMDGFEVCRNIKAIKGKEDIPIIFLTAKAQQQDITEGFELGAVDYIVKPCHAGELKARVATHLQLKRAKDLISQQNRQLTAKNMELERLNQELADSLEKIKTLEGILPICCICKKIRDDKGYWEQIEAYISNHSLAQFSHGICPDCLKKHYG
jgi:DNA-binding response OmpR family regulator